MLNMTPEEIWKTVLQFMKFAARLVVALVVLMAAAMLAFTVVMTLFRFTEWLWRNFLSAPWGS